MRVFLHTRSSGKHDWSNEGRDFGRLPIVGEFVVCETDSPWHEVQLVVHCPFDADYEAEVYAVQVDHMEAMNRAFADVDS